MSKLDQSLHAREYTGKTAAYDIPVTADRGLEHNVQGNWHQECHPLPSYAEILSFSVPRPSYTHLKGF